MNLPAWVDSPYWLAVGATMLHFLWSATIAFAVAACGRLLIRRAAPMWRYTYALAVLSTLAAMPVGLYAWMLSSMPGPEQPEATTRVAVAPTMSAPSSSATVGGSFAPHWRISTPSPSGAIPATQPAQAVTLPRRAMVWFAVGARYAPWCWLAGAPVVFAWLGCGVCGAERLRRQATLIADGPLVAQSRMLGAQLRVARDVAVAVSDRVATPLLLGVARPLIVLPAAFVSGWSPQELEMILLHELAHVRRWDNLVNLVQRAIEAALFFHPAVWRVSAWVRQEREHCCDAVVLRHSADPRAYAETLASLAMPGIAARHAVAAMANPNLVVRIRHILNLEESNMRVSYRWLSAMAAVIVVVAGAMAAATAQSTGESGTGASAPTAGGSTSGQPGAGYGIVGTGKGPSVGTATFGVSGLAVDFAGVYTSEQSGKRRWGPEQATGAPDTKTMGDIDTAWASATADGQTEWLEVSYAEPVQAIAVVIFESFNPGAITTVEAVDDSGARTTLYSVAQGTLSRWRSRDTGHDTVQILPQGTFSGPVGIAGAAGLSGPLGGPSAGGGNAGDSESGAGGASGGPEATVIGLAGGRLAGATGDGGLVGSMGLMSPPTGGGSPRALVVPITATSAPIKRLRITLNSAEISGWNEIDAVGLLDASCQAHWAVSAEASSTYADNVAPQGGSGRGLGEWRVDLSRQLQGAPSANAQYGTTMQTWPMPAGTLAWHQAHNATGQCQNCHAMPADERLQRLENELQEVRKLLEDLRGAKPQQLQSGADTSGAGAAAGGPASSATEAAVRWLNVTQAHNESSIAQGQFLNAIQEIAQPQRFKLEILQDCSASLELPVDVREATVANPEMVACDPRSARELKFTAKGVGTTEVRLAGGDQPIVIEITVLPNEIKLQEAELQPTQP